ncbi:MAG: hypothetical protein ACYSWU_25640 [Planctomycetota bacterium]|jgi:hypothetical protein
MSKGSKNRTSDRRGFRENFDQIDWTMDADLIAPRESWPAEEVEERFGLPDGTLVKKDPFLEVLPCGENALLVAGNANVIFVARMDRLSDEEAEGIRAMLKRRAS